MKNKYSVIQCSCGEILEKTSEIIYCKRCSTLNRHYEEIQHNCSFCGKVTKHLVCEECLEKFSKISIPNHKQKFSFLKSLVFSSFFIFFSFYICISGNLFNILTLIFIIVIFSKVIKPRFIK